jgi:hypothetical protein
MYKKEVDAIEGIVRLLKVAAGKQLILATASGWDTTHPVVEFQGPHAGSHANMLFKRAIFQTGDPVVLFLSRYKVDPSFREAHFKCRTDTRPVEPSTRNCYPVFGPDLKMLDVLTNRPVAICIGYEAEDGKGAADLPEIRKRIQNAMGVHLNNANFDFDYAAKDFVEDKSATGAVMFANEPFKQLFDR